MPLADRRSDYSWGRTSVTDLNIVPGSRVYALDQKVSLSVGFRVIGGLRESFTPDVWTVAWEDNDKLVRLMMESNVMTSGGLRKRLASSGKEVRRAKFYWSRDPDLPYRIWAAIVHEDGSRPIIPVSVEDAKSKFLDVVKQFEIPASSLGPGTHRLVGGVSVAWGRRSYIEKGRVSAKTKEAQVKVE